MSKQTVLTLSDLELAIPDMLENRLEVVKNSLAAKLYRPELERYWDELQALPGGQAATPVDLREQDAEHDGWGRAIYYLTEAYLHVPELDPKLREAALKARAEFIPTLNELNASYADEARAAVSHRASLATTKDALHALPVGPSGSLYKWAESFTEAGEKLGALLALRGERKASQGSRASAARLRAALLGVLGELRRGLSLEFRDQPDVPQRVFAYLDELAERRASSGPKPGESSSDGSDDDKGGSEPGSSRSGGGSD